MEIKNAVIESVTLEKGDRGLLQCWLHLSYGGSGQGFGGYALYLPKSFAHHSMQSVAGHFMFRCMEVAGVDNWADMAGRTIRVRADNGKVYAIGHIVKDDWFDPAEDFSARSDADEESEALRDMLGSARSDLDVMRNALGVPVEPHQSLLERMVEAAQAKRGAVPEWWKPMPVNGSYELARAFREAETAALLSGHDHIDAFHCGYRALIAAAPAPASADDASLSKCQARLFDVLVGDDGQAWAEAERYLETARPDLFATLRREAKPAKCDGNHGGPRCADPECWNDGPIALILDELRRAVTKFPTWPTDPLHALAVLGEEFGELTKATLQTTYEPHKSSHDDVRTEAIQTAAMALRFVISLERYEYTQGIQHQQEGQPA
ncbi:MAG: hypothetical protein IV112_08595 [Methyloversatilis discipulorum]|uniref:hypothetical protein n=1 Tax=Methyloversatilis discipulorum TaxID=1119528 RepID=UPI0026F2AD34|nr:hypothetical protein [Methyloversatilis discipulorum]MBT9516737.1 hypothetical protein [Methyloversatilis discipulorum]